MGDSVDSERQRPNVDDVDTVFVIPSIIHEIFQPHPPLSPLHVRDVSHVLVHFQYQYLSISPARISSSSDMSEYVDKGQFTLPNRTFSLLAFDFFRASFTSITWSETYEKKVQFKDFQLRAGHRHDIIKH